MIRTIFVAWLLLLLSTAAHAQLMIGCSSATANPGETVSLDVTVNGFADIVSLQYSMTWDPALLQFSSVSNLNPDLPGFNVSSFGTPPNLPAGSLAQSWLDPETSGKSLTDGVVLYTLNFTVLASFTTDAVVSFTGTPTSYEAVNGQLSEIPFGQSSTSAGSVGITGDGNPPMDGPLGLTLETSTNNTGDLVCVDLVATDFNSLLSMQYSLTYDPAVLQFNTINNINLVDFNTDSYGNPNPGIITVSWNDVSSGLGITLADGTVLFSFCFDVIGAGGTDSDLTIGEAPTPIEVTSTTTGSDNIGINATNGNVTVTGTGGAAINLTVANASGLNGETVCMDVSTANFTSVTDMQYSMEWDETIIQFSSVQAFNLSNLSQSQFNTSAANTGQLTMSWTDGTGAGITVADGTGIYQVCFTVLGSAGQSSSVDITSTPVVAQANQVSGAATLVDTPGTLSVSGMAGGFHLVAGTANALPGEMVCVPYTAFGFSDIVSMQYVMTYDPAVLQYENAQALNLDGLVSSNINSTEPGEIRISWLDPETTGETIANSTVIYEICFLVLGADGTSSALDFSDSPPSFPIEITDPDGTVPFASTAGSVTVGEGNTGGGGPGPEVPVCDPGFAINAGEVEAAPGATSICVPFTTQDFFDIVSMQYVMTYDPAILAFTGAQNLTLQGLNASAFNLTEPGMIRISWLDPETAGETVPNGSDPIYELCFDIIGGNCEASTLSFGSAPGFPVEITTPNGEISGFCDGWVYVNDGTCDGGNNGGGDPEIPVCDPGFAINAGEVEAAPGATSICVPFSTQNFFDIISMQYVMTYDPAILTYTGAQNLTLQGLNASAFNLTEPGMIRISWLDPETAGETVADGTTIYELCFDVIGANCDVSTLSFGDAPGFPIEITTPNGEVSGFCDGWVYVNDGTCGTVDPPMGFQCPGTPTCDPGFAINAGEVEAAPGDTSICVPYVTQDFFDIISMQYVMTYDPTSLEYVGAQNLTLQGLNPSAFNLTAPGMVRISWLDPETSGETVANGTAIYELCFNVIGTNCSSSVLSFDSAPGFPIEITTPNGEVSGFCDGLVCINNDDCEPTIDTLGSIDSTNLLITDVNCLGTATGAIDLAVLGTAPFTYAWSNGATTEDITGLAAGDYTVTITNSAGDATFTFAVLDPPSALSAMITNVTSISGAGATDGAIDIFVSGGWPGGYTFAWDNGATTEDLMMVGAGTYNVTITDSNGCETTLGPITVAEGLSATGTITDVNCFGESTGAIDLTVMGGVEPYTFSWNNMAESEDISGLAQGTYIVTVTDAGGSTTSAQLTVMAPASALNAALVGITDATTGNTGAIDINVSGGTTPYSFVWSNAATTEDLINVPADSYSVVVTDANGCTANLGPFTVNNVGTPVSIDVPNSIVTNPSCNGVNDGAIDVAISGGVDPITYAWSNTFTTQDISGLQPSNYTLTVTDGNGNTDTHTFTVEATPAIVITEDAITQQSGPGAGDGAISVSVSGGTGPYTYNWNNGLFIAEDISGLGGGAYTLVVTDANGCTASYSGTINYILGIDYNATTITNVTCFGFNNGAIDLAVLGGAPPLTYTWSNTFITEDITGLAGGNYTVTIQDAAGNTGISTSFMVGEPGAINISINALPEMDPNANDGVVNISVTGGTTPYIYAWSGPDNYTSTAEDIGGLAPGDYTVVVTDANGCTSSASATVDAGSTPLVVTGVVTDATCNGLNDGSIDLTVAGGCEPYAFTWSNNFVVEDPFGLMASNYCVTVTACNGAMASACFDVGHPDALNIDITSVTDETVPPGSNGAIDITVTGGTPSYTYSWNNDATTEDISGLAGDGTTYCVMVTDGAGCTQSACAVVNTVITADPLVIEPDNTVITHVNCNGENTGAIDLVVTGGLPPYTYQWNPTGFTMEDIGGILAGIYSVTVTDDLGSIATASFFVNEPSSPLVIPDPQVTDATINQSNGSITIMPNGGTPGYTYEWSHDAAANTGTVTGLSVGTYNVVVTDMNGCTVLTSIVVNSIGTPVVVTGAVTQIACVGEDTGEVDLSVTGGVPPYGYVWSGPNDFSSSQEDITGLAIGAYTVTVTDTEGSSGTATFNISTLSASALTAIVQTIENESIAGLNDGSITIDIMGGETPYAATWSTGAMTQNLENISCAAGTSYSVTVSDFYGCEFVLGPISCDVTDGGPMATGIITDVNCSGESTGAIDLTVTGGCTDTPYTYEWSNSMLTEDQMDIPAGIYTVTVTDCLTNTTTSTFVIEQPDEAVLVEVTSLTEPSCFGELDGAIEVSVSGGVDPYTYAWNTGETTANLPNAGAGTHILTVTDANGCVFVADGILLGEPGALDINAVVIPQMNDNCGSIDVTVIGGTLPLTYDWSHDADEHSEDLECVEAFTYSVTVTDGAGCTATNIFIVDYIPDPIIIISVDVSDVLCFGGDDGSIDITAEGGIPPYFYQWADTSGVFSSALEDINGLSTGKYTVTVTDIAGNTKIEECIIVEEPASEITLVSADPSPEVDGGDGAINLMIAGGSPTYIYQWSNGAETEDINNLDAGEHNVTIVDANGCIASFGPFEVGQPAPCPGASVIAHATCNGNADGAINLEIDCGAVQAYAWSTGDASQDIVGLTAGDYIVTVTGANGQSFEETFTVNEPGPITIMNVMVTPELCYGFGDAMIDIDVLGGTPTFVYQWSHDADATSQDVDNLVAGEYSVTILDANNCAISSSNYTVLPGNPCINESSTVESNVTCFNENDGFINLETIGDDGTFSYTWTGPESFTSNNKNISGLAPGEYFVTVTTLQGTTTEASYIIESPAEALAIDVLNFMDPVNGADGEIDIDISGGTPIYNYDWTGPGGFTSNLDSLTDLNAGTYTVVVTDAGGCTATAEYMLAPLMSFSAVASEEACNGAANGSIDLSVTGIGPFQFLWSNGETTEDLTSLSVGEYTVTTTDATGTTMVSDTYTVELSPDALLATAIEQTPQTQNEECDAVALATPVNGSGDSYTYLWDNGNTAATNPDLCEGEYSVTITDELGCSALASVIIDNPIPFRAVAQDLEHASCPGECDGLVTAGVEGNFTAPLSYLWSTGSTDQTIFDLCPGTYTCTVVDANGLTPRPLEIDIEEPEEIAIEFLDYQGTGLQASVTGGAAPYNYSWNTQDTTSYTDNLSIGDYSLVVSDANGCTALERVAYPLTATADGCLTSGKVISPNDDGKNDAFKISCIENYENRVEIYNRWGQLIFLTSNYDNTKNFWDGRDQSGDLLPEGGYFYVLEYTNLKGELDQIKGYVTLVRQ